MGVVYLPGMRKHSPESVPVTIPTVVVQVRADGTVDAAVDGHPLVPPDGVGRWRRSSLPEIIDQASHARTIPVRIDVREADGSVFTDLVAAHPTPVTVTVSEPKNVPRRAVSRGSQTVQAGGFAPGEDVAIAVITAHSAATGLGVARVHIDRDEFPDASEVILVGRVSGTFAIRTLA